VSLSWVSKAARADANSAARSPLGGQAYSQIILFKDRNAFRNFTAGNLEFGADASAVAIVAAAGAQVGTTGSSAAASVGRDDARAIGSPLVAG
jgi:hypothetical protein